MYEQFITYVKRNKKLYVKINYTNGDSDYQKIKFKEVDFFASYVEYFIYVTIIDNNGYKNKVKWYVFSVDYDKKRLTFHNKYTGQDIFGKFIDFVYCPYYFCIFSQD